MTCYQMQLKKSHKEVLNIIDKVIEKKETEKWAAKQLGISEHQFKELYEDVQKHMILV